MKLYRISAMLWASSPWINKGVPAMKCHKWPEQIMHIDATGAYGFASLRRTSTSKTSNCGKHQLWAVVWYKDSCWPASTQVSTHEGRKKEKLTASLHRCIVVTCVTSVTVFCTSGRPVEMDRTSEDFPTFDKVSTKFPHVFHVSHSLYSGNETFGAPTKTTWKVQLSQTFIKFPLVSTILRNDASIQLNLYKVKSRSYRVSSFPSWRCDCFTNWVINGGLIQIDRGWFQDRLANEPFQVFKHCSQKLLTFWHPMNCWKTGSQFVTSSKISCATEAAKFELFRNDSVRFTEEKKHKLQKHPAKNKQFAKCSDTLLIAHKAGSWSSKLLKCKRKPLKRSSIPSSAIKVASLPLSALIQEILLHLPFTSITFSEILTTMAWLALWVPISWICIRSCFKPATVKAVKAVNVKLAQGKLCSVQARALPKATPVWRQSTQKHKEFIGCHC